MLAIEDVVGAPAAAGVATRESFFSAAIVTEHAKETRHSSGDHGRPVEVGLPTRSGRRASDNPGLRFPRRQRISRPDGNLPFPMAAARQP